MTRQLLVVEPHPVGVARRVGAAWQHAGHPRRMGLVVALATGGVLAVVSAGPVAEQFGVAAVGTLLALAALVDLHELRLPNRLLAGGAAAAIAASLVLDRPLVAVVGGLVAALPMLAAHLRRGVGMGDVKMSFVVGAALPTPIAAVGAIGVAAFVAAVVGAVTGRQRVPLGPALWCGWALLVVLATAAPTMLSLGGGQ